MAHEYKLVLLTGNMDTKIYWCLECGLAMEWLTMGVAEMLPYWSKDRLLKEDRNKEKFTYAKDEPFIGKNNKTKRLGKGLKELLEETSKLTVLNKLLTSNVNKIKSTRDTDTEK